MTKLLITGAAGRLGAVLSSQLFVEAHTLRLFDLQQRPVTSRMPHEWRVGDVTRMADVEAAMDDVDTVVHLAALPDESSFADILQVNVAGTYNVFEAARAHGVRRVVFASSNHVVGFYPCHVSVSTRDPARPDTYYGVSKVFGEALGRLYHDKWQLEVVCIRIGSFRERPSDERQLSIWLSPRDAVHLVERTVLTPDVGYEIIYGMSNNTRNWWDNGAVAERFGYRPQDDAEVYAPDVRPGSGWPDDLPERLQGGVFTHPAYRGGQG